MKFCEKIQNIFQKHRAMEEQNIDYETAKIILKNEINTVLVDVRSPQEYKEGHLDGSINIPLYDLERNCEELKMDKEKIIILYCQYGSRSHRALKILENNGYKHLYQIKGGLDEINNL